MQDAAQRAGAPRPGQRPRLQVSAGTERQNAAQSSAQPRSQLNGRRAQQHDGLQLLISERRRKHPGYADADQGHRAAASPPFRGSVTSFDARFMREWLLLARRVFDIGLGVRAPGRMCLPEVRAFSSRY